MRGLFGVKTRSKAYNTVVNERPETLFLSRDCLEWLGNESEIKERIGGKIAYSRFFCSFGCGEHAEDEITAIYLKGAKRREFEPFVNSLGLGEFENEMLLRTLVAFDRERDELCIRSKLRAGITKNFSLDGFFNFRLGELKKRWDNLKNVTRENAPLLTDPDTFNVVLRFLLSAVTPEANEAEVMRTGADEFLLRTDGEAKRLAGRELIYRLIDVAPMSVEVKGELGDEIYDRIYGIFDVKSDETRAYFY